MPLVAGLTDEEADVIAQRVLAQTLGAVGFDHAEVHAGLDHDGDESLFVVAVLRPGSPILPSDIYAGAYEAVDDALRASGERRFSYFKVSRPDEPVGGAGDEE